MVYTLVALNELCFTFLTYFKSLVINHIIVFAKPAARLENEQTVNQPSFFENDNTLYLFIRIYKVVSLQDNTVFLSC
ncbi:hypothetical protein Mucpa_5426 [Mucilaginibacter paludis DSM 18603]|uniref:Uncharacterized protein n=1 Tax=Mucilaginibacter paludis DSM 18603 TaxID=714943 RepID=H1Y9C0_9SPHI|nr:hypothetical protein Mucpa_5426 [Mucilaginibacter paludis DSM 18603]